MQYWVNSEGHILPFRFGMSLSFDTMSGVRYWMRKFGYKLQEDKNA